MDKEKRQNKLTEWPNEPSFDILKGDLEASKPSQQSKVAEIARWRDLYNVTGSAKPNKVKGRSSIQPKLIRRQAEWRYAALTEPFLGSDKLFSVKPVSFEDKEAADQNELVLNWQFRTKLNKVKFIDDFVRTNVDEGTCIVRLGWDRSTKIVEEQVPVWSYMEVTDPSQIQQLEQALMMKEENPREYNENIPDDLKEAVNYFLETNTPVVAVAVGSQIVEKEIILTNRPTIDIMDPENVYIDPSCGKDINDAKFVIVSFETSQAELKKNPERYKNLDLINWSELPPVNYPEHSTRTPQDFNFKDELRKRVVAFEYWGFWDINGTGELVPIVATWIGNTLVRMEESPFPDNKPPFVVTNYMPRKREMYGEPDAELLEDNQKVLGALTRGMVDLLGRSANSQQGFAKTMLDPINRRRFDNGQDYEFNPAIPVAQGHIVHTYPELPNSAIVLTQMMNSEAEAITGVKAYSGGISGNAYGDVAAGIRGVLDASSKREMAILRRLAKGITEIGTKIIAMNSIFLSEEEVVRITNDTFITIKREDLAGNFDLEVDISTAEIDNNKAQDLGFLLQTIGNSMDFSITQMILSEIAKLKRMPDLSQAISKYQPQPDPMVEKMKELELMKLESEIELNKARAQYEIANANAKLLDSAEQGSGLTHERDKDKMRAQAQGNQDLEITKSLLTPKKKEESSPDFEAAVGYNALSRSGALDPSHNIGSKYFDPSLDPSLNARIGI